jgi:hypothetical protein
LFSDDIIDFGIADTGDCISDTLIISNVCSSPISLLIPTLSDRFSLRSSQTSPLVIGGNKNDTLIYEYCPNSDGGDSLSVVFTDALGTTYPVTFTGKGRIQTLQPSIHLVLPTHNEVAGTLFDYSIMIDTATDITHLNSLVITMTFDPIVAQPMSSTSGEIGNLIRAEETTPGTYTFTVEDIQIGLKKSIVSIMMMPLLSKHTSTPVIATTLTSYPNATLLVNQGNISVERCDDPPSNIIIPGDFSFDVPSPNPTNEHVALSFLIGAEGTANVIVSNTSGSVVLQETVVVTKGINEYHLDLSRLPTGRYSIAIDSWGWRETKPVVIIK